jgi:hypothetical protein
MRVRGDHYALAVIVTSLTNEDFPRLESMFVVIGPRPTSESAVVGNEPLAPK